ncbi:MAG: hypothetical protein JWQ90_4324 [Hydrocarboniphaga sp.]|uniref:hypothetical protein n=1 Tax=Hydrocarboniphaga sp. TaxID=2033016 RepID=UPI0026270A8C|nr:hypothetical protein [Hydrocarboniphaga sp.]MDB5971874.1 hypothetical protein [Hydrocarboniphaga sp.]
MTRLLHGTRQLGPIAGWLLAMAVMATAVPAAAAAQDAKTPAKPAADPPRQELQLDTTAITGSRELPTVMNILPWKHAPTSDLPGAPPDSLLNEVAQPVNRVEFRRELRYADPANSSQTRP